MLRELRFPHAVSDADLANNSLSSPLASDCWYVVASDCWYVDSLQAVLCLIQRTQQLTFPVEIFHSQDE